MGRRGPAPAPTALKLVKGETRPSRVNYREPIAPDGNLEPPDDLGGAALEVWERTAEMLEAMRVAKPADRDSLRAYVEAVVMHERTSAELEGAPLLVMGQKGNLVTNPLVRMQRDAAMLIKAFALEFGLTPRARSELKAPEGPRGDAKKRLLS